MVIIGCWWSVGTDCLIRVYVTIPINDAHNYLHPRSNLINPFSL